MNTGSGKVKVLIHQDTDKTQKRIQNEIIRGLGKPCAKISYIDTSMSRSFVLELCKRVHEQAKTDINDAVRFLALDKPCYSDAKKIIETITEQHSINDTIIINDFRYITAVFNSTDNAIHHFLKIIAYRGLNAVLVVKGGRINKLCSSELSKKLKKCADQVIYC